MGAQKGKSPYFLLQKLRMRFYFGTLIVSKTQYPLVAILKAMAESRTNVFSCFSAHQQHVEAEIRIRQCVWTVSHLIVTVICCFSSWSNSFMSTIDAHLLKHVKSCFDLKILVR